MPAKDLEIRAEMCDVGRRLWQRGLIGGSEGNLSVRLPGGRILCTPTGVSKGHMRPADLVLIDGDGRSLDGGRPSSEIKLHLRILAMRADCGSVIHAHPPIATALTLAGKGIPDDVLPEAAFILGRVAVAPFAMPGTEEVPDSVAPFISDHNTILLSHHGSVTLGKGLQDSYERMETLERIAKMIFASMLIGGPTPMPKHAFDIIAKRAFDPIL